MKTSTDRRTWTSVRVPPWKREPVPEASLRFAEERVSYLKGAAFSQPLQYLLACAYLQGINDCVAAHDRNPDIGKRADSSSAMEKK